ncbi:Minor extracellular protease vpr [Colletotrichum orbiculare MAFF 240422]|uniref:Minor extracellular protease vpr n=1 Tax=Colletotrichum orbiculare (strain 104-T / ATCC 96160 / CBS 514.97 / LARS 414 / MAFF 240422) TaxID=1213857 RepID=N4VDQ8_COLOR|nr:Minor extracellular protease vpr [Colletotrichum orbiculare MAFF 240422]
MFPITQLQLLPLALLWLAAVQAKSNGQDNNVFIVRLSEPYPESPFDDIRKSLADSGLSCDIVPRHAFSNQYFPGVSLRADCEDDPDGNPASVLLALQSLDFVSKAWPAARDENRLQKQQRRGVVSSGATIHARAPVLERRSLSNETGQLFSTNVLPTHKDTGVDRLHAEGTVGSGIRIAIIDTGFDLRSPGLSKTRVAWNYNSAEAAFDFVGDNCLEFLHGTHALGIIAAESDERPFGVVGVAPNATMELHGLDACDGSKYGQLDDLMAAIISAKDRGVDMIMIGLNMRLAFQEEPTAALVSEIVRNGTSVTAAAANFGPGLFTGGSPASAEGVAAVGSADNSATPYYTWRANWTSGDEAGFVRFAPSYPSDFPPNNNLTLWMPANPEDFPQGCNPAPGNLTLPADPANTIMLIDEDHCWLDPKDSSARLALSLGVPYVLRYQAASATVADGMQWVPRFAEYSTDYRGISRVSNRDGRLLKSLLAKGPVTVSVPSDVSQAHAEVVYQPNDLSGGLVSAFSSWGPTPGGKSYPSFLAPGENILSTFLPKYGGLAVIGGTSMSNPFAVGVLALVKEKHPDYDPHQILSAVVSTANPVKFVDGKRKKSDFLGPVFSQGGGLVDAWAAVHTVSLVNVSSLDFNDTANRPASLAFTITNKGSESLSYSLSHLGAASGYILRDDDRYSITGAEGHAIYAEMSIAPSTLHLAPGDSATVSVSVVSDPDLPGAAERGTFFGGYISIQSSASEAGKLSVPYTGFGTRLVDVPMINPNQSYLITLSDSGEDTRLDPGTVVECLYNATIPKPEGPVSCTPGLPGFRKTFLTQSRNYTFDLVDAKSTKDILPGVYQGTSSSNDEPSSLWAWNGAEEDRKFIPPGQYSWRVTALRLNGNADDPKHWDTWLSETWTLAYSSDSIGLPTRAN